MALLCNIEDIDPLIRAAIRTSIEAKFTSATKRQVDEIYDRIWRETPAVSAGNKSFAGPEYIKTPTEADAYVSALLEMHRSWQPPHIPTEDACIKAAMAEHVRTNGPVYGEQKTALFRSLQQRFRDPDARLEARDLVDAMPSEDAAPVPVAETARAKPFARLGFEEQRVRVAEFLGKPVGKLLTSEFTRFRDAILRQEADAPTPAQDAVKIKQQMGHNVSPQARMSAYREAAARERNRR